MEHGNKGVLKRWNTKSWEISLKMFDILHHQVNANLLWDFILPQAEWPKSKKTNDSRCFPGFRKSLLGGLETNTATMEISIDIP